MRWTNRGTSRNVEDRRGGGIGRIPLVGGGAGCLIVAVLLGLSLLTGENFLALLDLGQGGGAPAQQSAPSSPAQEELVGFVSFVLDDAQEVWREQLASRGVAYRDARLVLFTGRVSSACGVAGAQVGPFYCPGDERVYIDLSFYEELRSRFGAPGDFAQAYVLAHEIGHHVQHQLGIAAAVRSLQGRDPAGANRQQVAMELQADCLAGVWAHSTRQRELLEAGDVAEAMEATAAVGDDRIQREATGTVQPESWTHGSSEQRTEWFLRGFDSGSLDACDTFEGRLRLQ